MCEPGDGLVDLLTRGLREDEIAAAAALAGAPPDDARRMYGRYPDLFVGRYASGQLIGVCCGWPALHPREQEVLVRLEVIAVLPPFRAQGHGRLLLDEWERRVAVRGSSTIDVGSAADGFFLRCGYTPVEYCLKIPADRWDPARASELAISHRVLEDRDVVLYTRIEGGYRQETKEALARMTGARSAITILRKHVGPGLPGVGS
jgi:N-acetylglutamate synthase-like GNAT family acetyltransferase